MRPVAALLVFAALGGTLVGARPLAWLGVSLGAAPDAAGGAARVLTVLRKSPAERAALRAGDLVIRAGGRRIRSPADLIATVTRRRPGGPLALVVRRDDQERTVTTVLAARPPDLHRLLEEGRDAWQEPERVMAALGLAPGAVAADVGAGGGYFTERLADAVGPDGLVLAVEIDARALAALERRFRSTHPQVRVHRGRPGDPLLPRGRLDAILLVDTYHELTAPAAILAAVHAALRAGGRLVIVDRPAESRRPGAHAIPADDVIAAAADAGFALASRSELPRQFLLVFTRDPGAAP